MKECVVLGGTGFIGQQFIRLLENHPNLQLKAVYASSRSAGKTISEIWNLPYYSVPESLADIEIMDLANIKNDFDFAFSGLPTIAANEIETNLAKQGIGVFSNASANRMGSDVPILIPEVNGQQAPIIKLQQEKYGTPGFVITNANCSVTGLAMYLSELRKVYDFDYVVISTYQAMSGAGNSGVAGIEISGNVLPFIANEEDKIAIEANKILGKFDGKQLVSENIDIVANCARVPTVDGHLEAITVRGPEIPNLEDVKSYFKNISSPLEVSKYHTAPKHHVKYLSQENRPQPALDANRGENDQTRGMTTYVGRLRQSKKSLSAYVMVHNTIRGGAGGSILNAEYILAKNLV